MKDVFISYKAEEYDEANWVRTTLETNGISCWMAPASIPGGSSYAVEIPQAIRQAKVFILILSSKAQSSKWVSREVDLAINEGKVVLPFMLEKCDLKDDFNFYLTNVQRYAAYENKAAAIEKMLREIKVVLGINDSPSEVECQQSQREQKPYNVLREQEPRTAKKSQKVKKNRINPVEKLKESIKVNNKKAVLFSAIAAAVILLLTSIILIINANRVEIAGEKFSVNEEYFYFDDITFTDEDVESFEKIKEIDSLNFTNCKIETNNIKKIVNRVESVLKIEGCSLTDGDIGEFDFSNSSITNLSLNDNKDITDLSRLEGFGEKLYSLSFNNCSVENVEFLKNCTGLSELQAQGNNIIDISVVSNMPNLTKINFANNEITTLESLRNLNGLYYVDVSGNKLKSLSGLENALKLDIVRAADNQITDLKGITNATVITTADFSNNKITDISLLEKSKEKLTSLNLSGNQIGDVSPLAECFLLKEININNTGVATINFVSKFSELKSIYASNNRITDISAIANCKKLVNIDLSNNAIINVVTPEFENEVGLFNLSHNKITALNIPACKYHDVMLYGNSIGDLSSLNKTKGWNLVFNHSADIDYKALSESNYYSYIIFDCPPDEQLAVKEALGYGVEFTTEKDYLSKQSENN